MVTRPALRHLHIRVVDDAGLVQIEQEVQALTGIGRLGFSAAMSPDDMEAFIRPRANVTLAAKPIDAIELHP